VAFAKAEFRAGPEGKKPAQAVSIEQPTKFQLVLDLTTAKLLGLEGLPALVASADEVVA